jgi:hypothetical protein
VESADHDDRPQSELPHPQPSIGDRVLARQKRDAELREYAHEGWARYRAPFTRTVVEGRNTGFLAPTVSPDDAVDLLLISLRGTMLTRVLLLPVHSADNFRNVLLRQVAEVLGRAL